MASRKGKPNKLGHQARENIVAVFTRLGGTAEMANWAKEHRTEFYRIYAQLVPKEITADVRVTSEIDLTDEQLADIAAGCSTGAAEAEEGTPESSGVH